MYLEIKSIEDYAANNEEFRNHTSSLLEYIFNPNKIVFNYIKSTSNNFTNQRHSILDPRDLKKADVLTVDVDSREKTEGIFEECLKNHIISQDYSVLILTGASGSGKTSIIKHVKDEIKECYGKEKCIRFELCDHKKKEILYYDFLDTETGSNTQNILEMFEYRLNAFLNLAVKSCFVHNGVLYKFLNYITHENQIFYQLKLTLSPIEYSSKIEDILIKIKQSSESMLIQNDMLTLMLNYFRKQYPNNHKGCFTIIYDNIDRLDDSDQSVIIKNIISLHNKINCKLVITSRLTTFHKLNDNFSNTTSVLENAGQSPIDVLYYRIQYYLANKGTIQDIIDIRENIKQNECRSSKSHFISYLEHFDNILYELQKYLSPIGKESGIANNEVQINNFKKELVQKTLSSFSGLSIRRCLDLSKRFINSFVYNHYKVPTSNQLIASLTYRSLRGTKFTDKYITNIYGRYDDNRKNSWLLYKILNILLVSHNNKLPLSVSQLFDLLNLYDNINQEDILSALNVLIKPDKRLAFISGVSQIDNSNEEPFNKQKIQLTNSGMQYHSFLSTDLTYLQNCFAALDWKTIAFYTREVEINNIFSELSGDILHKKETEWLIDSLKEHYSLMYLENAPKVFNVNNIFERMQFMRNSLEIMLYHDVFESYFFNKNRYIKKNIENIVSFLQYSDQINSFPILKLTIETINSFIRILKSYIRNESKMNYDIVELKLWQTFCKKVDLWHKLIFKTHKSYSEEIVSNIEELIVLIDNNIAKYR